MGICKQLTSVIHYSDLGNMYKTFLNYVNMLNTCYQMQGHIYDIVFVKSEKINVILISLYWCVRHLILMKLLKTTVCLCFVFVFTEA